VADLVMRQATEQDADALHALISAHRAEGHLLPRELAEIRRHASRFVVCDVEGEITACGELAPLSDAVAEVRSLVVSKNFRRVGLAARMVSELRRRAISDGFQSICAFTHDARFFVRQNFSIVPHSWVPEKIAVDCKACPLFNRCGQYAMVLSLDAVAASSRPAAERRRAVA
jgi:amino-acid N-acetyltransferase